MVGTGGLSHQVHGERTGFNNEAWDRRFLDLLENDPEQLTRMRHVDFIRLGGAESVEQIMWLAMRGALSPTVRQLHLNYYLATTTAMTVAPLRRRDAASGHRSAGRGARTAMNPQLAGIEAIEGTYVFDLRVSHRTLKLNRF